MHDTNASTNGSRLSIAMIVRNDALALEQTLASVSHIADEIVIVDTGSTDNTRQIAEKFKAKACDFPWCDDFSAARNHAIEQVTGDWTLWLDAGETFSENDAAALKQAIAGGQLDASTAYAFVVRPPAAPNVIAAEQIAQIRLIPHASGVRFQGRVRESIHETLENVGISIDGLPFRIERGNREHDDTLKRRRAQRNLHLADLEIAERGRTPTMINCLAEAAQALGSTQRAVELYSETLNADDTGSNERLEAYYGLLTSLDATPNARQSQLSLCIKALEEFPLDAQLLCAMGGYLQADGKIDLAIRSYQTAYDFGHVNPLVWHLDEITAIAVVCHSAALQAQGQDDAALQVLQTALTREGDVPRLRKALMELHIKHGRRDVALQQVPLIANNAARVELARAVEGACLASRKDWANAQSLLQQAYAAGCRDAVCFRWLTITLLATQQQDAAGHLLKAWCQCHPADPEPRQIAQAIFGSNAEATSKPANFRIDSPAALASQRDPQSQGVSQ